ncbi:thiamine-phosphate kinase [Aneurinibacillus aneurinilyticus]|jgi:thiamine-monophosphate kinase|uniref:Thiamine-monophosphate kinase n=2 Tax=Aneurinibacillus aneurinilyticus TaxID=1391 RepID=A0A848D171_ANEAE|nr:thiamine-phosphate kinase [Aneurinibacillus aneurinilyticus]ERI11722.1 thiamine-phosphate kinase [Aneurinibacillus aneurinilyticus ATCC 12856]MCI1696588.1 thiamine-phosphate kinase [Aneurinibacillus aneurinilyticus]MED0669392.1 thiamine-phosphate kinase [Aneurinibacillus aneurinilyticus]MED0705330.1 thiamine-phosphate kinase [Aneurinibacillus aneurinilyticus]MED0725893.1 thiamine-phosphate kinase [Aneurinibacillus aneurinilyticus]
MTENRRDEFGLISYVTGRQKVPTTLRKRITVGNGDDAAIVAGRVNYEWVACCDTMVEDVHFKRQTMLPSDIGHKALASNISDVAAMGGIPLFYLVSLGLPHTWSEEEVAEIYDGMGALALRYNMALIGGDTVAVSGPLTLTITVLGEVERGHGLLRSSARPGDAVFLTGTVGDSGAGLDILLQERWGIANIPAEWMPLANRHRLPEPDVQAGRLLATSGIRVALNDISDGLASEAWEIAQASNVRLELEEAAIPLSAPILHYADVSGNNALDWAFYGGEDYRLVGCVSAKHKENISRAFAERELPLYWIGEVQAGSPEVRIHWQNGESTTLPKKGYNHFNEER